MAIEPTTAKMSDIDDTSSHDGFGCDLETISNVHSATDDTTAHESHSSDSQRFVLATDESTKVKLSKMLVIFVLFLSVTVAAVLTFIITRREEQHDFRTEFEGYASEVAAVSQINTENLFDAYNTLSVALTSAAIISNSTWPFVTVPLYEALGGGVRERLNAQFVGILPFVTEENREKWEKYSVENQWWINEGLQHKGLPPTNDTIAPFIFTLDPAVGKISKASDPPRPIYAPAWQISPVETTYRFVNFDRYPVYASVFEEMKKLDRAVLSKVLDLSSYSSDLAGWPQSSLVQPIHDSLTGVRNIVAAVGAYISWHSYFENVLPEGIGEIILTVNNNCGQVFSYAVQGPKVQYLGPGEVHDAQFDFLEHAVYNTTWKTQEGCDISLHFYPTKDLQHQYTTRRPAFYTIGVIFVFFITAVVFELYDCLVQRRQQKVVSSAAQSHAIVNSFFPSHVRARILEDHQEQDSNNKKTFMAGAGKPIAELHPHATVMIADIANFTAWSSVREPAQVFTLLETVYTAFDLIAKKRKVFKVETIGDSYVAVAGLPEPRDDHAVVMARFANSCISKMNEIVLELETSLGLGTADLAMRFGLHSGAVTAGVLRGERSRFQLFGDTINTAARIESTGMINKIHVSQQTADELKAAGKGSWLIRREEKVMAKGKGELQTYWVEIHSSSLNDQRRRNSRNDGLVVGDTESSQNSSQQEGDGHTVVLNNKEERLVSWHVDVLSRLLKRIALNQNNRTPRIKNVNDGDLIKSLSSSVEDLRITSNAEYTTVLEEVKEIITLPNKKAQENIQGNPNSIELSPEVMRQLRRYVTMIASMYRNNSFHSFEHASHVAQSLTKLLSRVVADEVSVNYDDMCYKKATAETLHKFTYGIASDPLTQFACAFSALIHDVDHRGVPNTRLVQEEPDLAQMYKNKSVAEQNSVDLSWELLMEPAFKELRGAIYTNQSELNRFRQLVVNSVMATDIVDKELGALRKKRWNKAFQIDSDDSNDDLTLLEEDELDRDAINRKATIVIEHLIQAADVAHTMQHWHVYLKWNERFFHENYQAYLDGRLEKDPSIGWYEGEIGFFDYYIIPLAKKLESCGVFGVSSDECLDYATANRNEWKTKGKGIVEKYMLHYEKK